MPTDNKFMFLRFLIFSRVIINIYSSSKKQKLTKSNVTPFLVLYVLGLVKKSASPHFFMFFSKQHAILCFLRMDMFMFGATEFWAKALI